MDTRTHTQGNAVRAKAQDAPGIDPTVGLLVAFVSVLLALTLGTGLFLLLPATI